MTNIQQEAQQLEAALDRIAAAKANPQQVEQAVNDAKTKLKQMVQQAGQGQQSGQGQQGGQQR